MNGLSHIYEDGGLELGIARLESPDRYKHHDPEKIFMNVGLLSGESFADLGCGTGFFALPAAKIIGKGGVVHAVDKVPEILALLKKKVEEAGLTNVKILRADVTATGIKDHTIDTVLMANVFHDVEKESMTREIRRILKPTGRIVVVEWKKIDTQKGPPLERRLAPEELKNILERDGWKVTSSFDVSSSHYVTVANFALVQ